MKIITLTINPALDKSAKVDGLLPSQKMRCHSIQYQPGGGGINVSRVLSRLGSESDCVFPIGGNTGDYLNTLLADEGVKTKAIEIESWTRENLAVVDTLNGQQYRFGMPGNPLSEKEVENILAGLEDGVDENDLLVLSGSLPPGLSDEFYARVIKKFNKKGVKMVVDSSGPALTQALKEPVFLFKPNQKELAEMAEKPFLSKKEQESFAQELVEKGKAKYVVVSMGARGAFLCSSEGIFYQTVPSVEVKSTIGAGDSMVAGLLFAYSQGFSSKEMLDWGIACGVGTTMGEGTDLASYSNIKNIISILAVQ